MGFPKDGLLTITCLRMGASLRGGFKVVKYWGPFVDHLSYFVDMVRAYD